MKIENQVCTLEQAKKLKELGVVQNTFFYWHKDETLERGEHWGVAQMIGPNENTYSAFTVADLGVMLDFIPAPTTGNEAIDRANAVILRLEYGFITIEEVNQRLQAA